MAIPVDEYTRRVELWKRRFPGAPIPPSLSRGLPYPEEDDNALLDRIIGQRLRTEPEASRPMLRLRPGNGKVSEPILSDDVARVLAGTRQKTDDAVRHAEDHAEMLPGKSDDDLAAQIAPPRQEDSLLNRVSRPSLKPPEAPERRRGAYPELRIRQDFGDDNSVASMIGKLAAPRRPRPLPKPVSADDLPAPVDQPAREYTRRDTPAPRGNETVVTAERRLTPKDIRRFAVEPGTMPAGDSDLAALINGMTQDNSDLTDGLPMNEYIKRQKAAKAERDIGTRLDAADRIGDRQMALKRQSGQSTQNATQRNLMQSIMPERYRELNRLTSLGRQEDGGESTGYQGTMREFEDRQKYANNRVGGIRQAERGGVKDTAATASWQRRQPDAARGNGGNDSISAEEQDTPQEIAAREARFADPNSRGKRLNGVSAQEIPDSLVTRLPGGSRITRNVEGGFNVTGPPGLDREANQRNIDNSADRSRQNKQDAAQGLNDGYAGKERPSDAGPDYNRRYEQGRRERLRAVGPTADQTLSIQREAARNGVNARTGVASGSGVRRSGDPLAVAGENNRDNIAAEWRKLEDSKLKPQAIVSAPEGTKNISPELRRAAQQSLDSISAQQSKLSAPSSTRTSDDEPIDPANTLSNRITRPRMPTRQYNDPAARKADLLDAENEADTHSKGRVADTYETQRLIDQKELELKNVKTAFYDDRNVGDNHRQLIAREAKLEKELAILKSKEHRRQPPGQPVPYTGEPNF